MPEGRSNWPSLRSLLAERADELALPVEHSDAVEPLVGHVDVALAVDGRRGGPDELTLAGTGLANLTDYLFVAGNRPDRELHQISAVAPAHDEVHVIAIAQR